MSQLCIYQHGNEWAVGYREVWLGAGTYLYRDQLNSWLDQHGIAYRHRQDGKLFEWFFTSRADAVMFHLTWC